MGKILKTLARAKLKREPGTPRLLERLKDGPAPPARSSAEAQGTESYLEYYEELKTNLIAYHHTRTIKTILVLGTSHGDGASTTAINLATTLARDGQLNVLLIEANLRKPSLQEVFHVESEQQVSGFPAEGDKRGEGFKKVGPENLYVVTPGSHLSGPLSLFESQRFWEFLKTMRTEFNYVILDGPPLPSYSESKVICNKVDGVVMVVESGKTRKQVALRAKREIEKAGGTVLGVVLNKRKFHIPKWIYELI
jgi:capsular exopolysaccharide synthesis family protein